MDPAGHDSAIAEKSAKPNVEHRNGPHARPAHEHLRPVQVAVRKPQAGPDGLDGLAWPQFPLILQSNRCLSFVEPCCTLRSPGRPQAVPRAKRAGMCTPAQRSIGAEQEPIRRKGVLLSLHRRRQDMQDKVAAAGRAGLAHGARITFFSVTTPHPTGKLMRAILISPGGFRSATHLQHLQAC